MHKTGIHNTKPDPVAFDYQENVDVSIQLCRWILKSIGAWPSSFEVSPAERCFYRLVNAVCYSLIGFHMTNCGLCLFLEIEEVYDKLKLTGPLLFYGMAFLKYYSLILRGDEIRKCVKCIETDWKTIKYFKDRSIMLRNAIFGRRLVTLCVFFLYSAAVFYYIAVPARVGKIVAEDENLTFIPLVSPISKLIVDTRHSPANEIYFSIQFGLGFLTHTITAGACSLAAVFAMHVCGQTEVLICWLEHLVDGREDMSKDINIRFAEIVKLHNRVLSFLVLTERIIQQISLIEIFGCTLDLCLLGYYLIVEWGSENFTAFITYSILLVSFTFNIFIFCYIGELVSAQCKRVGEISYMTDWYRIPRKNSLNLVLMIAMSNSSIKLTAGNLIELSLASFGDVVRAAVTFLNMLRKLTT